MIWRCHQDAAHGERMGQRQAHHVYVGPYAALVAWLIYQKPGRCAVSGVLVLPDDPLCIGCADQLAPSLPFLAARLCPQSRLKVAGVAAVGMLAWSVDVMTRVCCFSCVLEAGGSTI